MDCTMQALRNLGHVVEVFNWQATELSTHVVHVFGGFYHQAELIQRLIASGHKVVVTPNLVRIHAGWRYRLAPIIARLPLQTTISLRRSIIRSCHAVCVVSAAEAHDAVTVYGANPNTVHVVPNGVEQRFFSATPQAAQALLGMEPFVLCVASIEPNKNQVALIEALGPTGIPLVLVGAEKTTTAHHQARYMQQFRDALQHFPSVRWLGGIDHANALLPSLYAAARVHVLASHAEAQGVASLEAAAAGAHVVMSNVATLHSVFGNDVDYCQPNSVESIRAAVEHAFAHPRSHISAPWLTSWDSVAKTLVSVYRGCVG